MYTTNHSTTTTTTTTTTHHHINIHTHDYIQYNSTTNNTNNRNHDNTHDYCYRRLRGVAAAAAGWLPRPLGARVCIYIYTYTR